MAETVQQRVAEVLGAHGCSAVSFVDGDAICATCDRVIGHADDDLLAEMRIENAHAAQMLADEGLLATPVEPGMPPRSVERAPVATDGRDEGREGL